MQTHAKPMISCKTLFLGFEIEKSNITATGLPTYLFEIILVYNQPEQSIHLNINKANRHKSRAPRKQRPTDRPTDGPTERLIESCARDYKFPLRLHCTSNASQPDRKFIWIVRNTLKFWN